MVESAFAHRRMAECRGFAHRQMVKFIHCAPPNGRIGHFAHRQMVEFSRLHTSK
jgi:hypothetical protein